MGHKLVLDEFLEEVVCLCVSRCVYVPMCIHVYVYPCALVLVFEYDPVMRQDKKKQNLSASP